MLSLPVAESLRIDPAAEAERIQEFIRQTVFIDLRRKGAVVAISGGVDSSVVAALCARALGANRVLGLLLPEADSSTDSARLAHELARFAGIRTETEDITPVLTAAGCYRRRDESIRLVIPEYRDGYKCKLVMQGGSDHLAFSLYSVVVESPTGERTTARLTLEALLGIVASTNFKQRTRKMMEYYYADRLNYAVVGTPNLLEYDQGFFVKNGDGAADLKPIAHLYKSQVYQLAEWLGIPEEIRKRPPTTDTYSLDQSQEEFYFAVSCEKMDVCLWAKNHGLPAEEAAKSAGLPPGQVERVYRLIDQRRAASRYLHAHPALVAAA